MRIRNFFMSLWEKFRRRGHTCAACGCAVIEEVRLYNPETGEEYVYDLPRGYIGRRKRKEDFAEAQRNFTFADALRSGFITKMHGVVGGKAKEDVQQILEGVRSLEIAWQDTWGQTFDALDAYRNRDRESALTSPFVKDALQYLGVDLSSSHGNDHRVLWALEATRVPVSESSDV